MNLRPVTSAAIAEIPFALLMMSVNATRLLGTDSQVAMLQFVKFSRTQRPVKAYNGDLKVKPKQEASVREVLSETTTKLSNRASC